MTTGSSGEGSAAASAVSRVDSAPSRLRVQSRERARGGRGFALLELGPVFDNDAISSSSNPGDGAFNVWGNTLPAEGLPPGGSEHDVEGIPVLIPPLEDGAANSVVCRRQLLELEPRRCDWIHVLAASERRTEDFVHLHYADGAVDPEWLRVSDFWPSPARFGEIEAFRFEVMHYPRHVQPQVEGKLWLTRIPVPRRQDLTGLRLPENAAAHIFALTLELAPAG
jgi:hypothetical protein